MMTASNTIRHYRKQPVVIRAIQWDGSTSSLDAILGFVAPEAIEQYLAISPGGGYHTALRIKTLEGVHEVTSGDYIIEGVQGEFYPCKPDIFAATYERA